MYNRTVEEVIATLHPENGEVFLLSAGRRRRLAKCSVRIDIVQHTTTFKARNPKGYDVKKRYISLVFCLDPEMAAGITDEIFQSVEGYEVYCEIERSVGNYEKIKLDKLLEESVDLYENEWEFRIEDAETVKKLLKMYQMLVMKNTFENKFQGCFFMPIFRKEVVMMAVKVIKYGSKRRVTCGCCESLLEYEKDDMETVRTGMNEYESSIICPNCHEAVRVKQQNQ